MDFPCGRWGREHKMEGELARRGGDPESLHRARSRTCPGIGWQEGQWVQADRAAPGFAVMGKHAVPDPPSCRVTWQGRGRAGGRVSGPPCDGEDSSSFPYLQHAVSLASAQSLLEMQNLGLPQAYRVTHIICTVEGSPGQMPSLQSLPW